jgi:hypothetical protein
MHSIRLRGPWRYEVLERHAGDNSLPKTGKQQLPADWAETLGSDFRGKVRYRRTFHQPTGLEEGQQVCLAIDLPLSAAEVRLNGDRLPADDLAAGGWRCEVQDLLLPTSELIIDVTHAADAEGCGGLMSEVRLEIQTVSPRPVE